MAIDRTYGRKVKLEHGGAGTLKTRYDDRGEDRRLRRQTCEADT
jgi:hypothetical protein